MWWYGILASPIWKGSHGSCNGQRYRRFLLTKTNIHNSMKTQKQILFLFFLFFFFSFFWQWASFSYPLLTRFHVCIKSTLLFLHLPPPLFSAFLILKTSFPPYIIHNVHSFSTHPFPLFSLRFEASSCFCLSVFHLNPLSITSYSSSAIESCNCFSFFEFEFEVLQPPFCCYGNAIEEPQ